MLDVSLTCRKCKASVAPPHRPMTAPRLSTRPTAKRRALAALARQPDERLFEVAFGTGFSFTKQVKASGAANAVAVDLSPGMLATARAALAEAGVERPPLGLADARMLTFADESFDCVFNSSMIDLIPTDEIATVVPSSGACCGAAAGSRWLT